MKGICFYILNIYLYILYKIKQRSVRRQFENIFHSEFILGPSQRTLIKKKVFGFQNTFKIQQCELYFFEIYLLRKPASMIGLHGT